MTSTVSDSRLLDAPEEPGAVAARCRHLADQLAGGPVRDALLEMARDYTRQAYDAARTAGFRLELERSQRDATAVTFFAALDRFIDGVRRVTPRLPQPPVAAHPVAAQPVAPAVTAAPAPTVSPKRVSRLYRIHALQPR